MAPDRRHRRSLRRRCDIAAAGSIAPSPPSTTKRLVGAFLTIEVPGLRDRPAFAPPGQCDTRARRMIAIRVTGFRQRKCHRDHEVFSVVPIKPDAAGIYSQNRAP